MRSRVDVKSEGLEAWNHYECADAKVACERMYARVDRLSKLARNWYWASIKSKRSASFMVRIASFTLLIAGAVLPVTAAMAADVDGRLMLTQLGIVCLAVAGLLQAGDKVFGWSSGWLRYMTTVTAMESTARDFELNWASYILNREGELASNDKIQLFALAKQFESDISRLQGEETDKWVGEFNSSLGLLNELIRSQRDSAEQTAQAARAAVNERNAAALKHSDATAAGGIEVTIKRAVNTATLRISLDGKAAEEFQGSVRSYINVHPGLHKIEVTDEPRSVVVQRIATVPPGGIAALEVNV
jgi:hypothetical protein